METVKKYYRVDRREIGYLRFILESYDGVAVLTTVDSQKGVVVIHIPPGRQTDADMIIRDLEKEILIEELETPAVDREERTTGWKAVD